MFGRMDVLDVSSLCMLHCQPGSNIKYGAGYLNLVLKRRDLSWSYKHGHLQCVV